jgi:hypothetical protein
MPGIMEFLSLIDQCKLIVSELPDGNVTLTLVDTIARERQSITLSPATAYQASHAIRFASHQES